MRVDGRWEAGEDGIRRPVVSAGRIGPGGMTRTFPFLVDTGADSTVLTYWAVSYLGVEVESTGTVLHGVGGSTPAVAVRTRMYLLTTARELAGLGGRLLAHPYPTGSEDELSILGRDLLNNFAVIVDRPANVVCLLSGNHRYVIQES